MFDRTKAVQFDFVLCDPCTLEVKIVIELIDRVNNRAKDSEQRILKRRTCQQADIPYFSQILQQKYDHRDILMLINYAMFTHRHQRF